LRDIVLAGGAGALAVVGCVDGSGAPGDAGSEIDVNSCCNASADPCCPSLYCGETATAQCTEMMACESEGGAWDYFAQRCAADAGPSDASSDVTEAGSSDTGVDGQGQPDEPTTTQ